jgi:hypothetical protein
MILGQVFERFVEESPVSVMVRGLLEKILSPEKLDALFERSTQHQYTRELLFSTVVEMMNSVTCGIRPSIHAAYQARASQMSVSVTSVYNKLNAMESPVSAELVRETSIDVFPTEDGHAQERSLLDEVLKSVEEDDLWIADRNFCTLKFLSSIVAQKGYFIVREHQCLPWYDAEEWSYLGEVDGGRIWEQIVVVSDDDGYLSKIRRVKVTLEEETRDGDSEIFILNKEWQVFARMSFSELTEVLRDLATQVNLATLLRHPRTPKKTRRRYKRTRPVKRPHVSTAKILSQNQTTKSTP